MCVAPASSRVLLCERGGGAAAGLYLKWGRGERPPVERSTRAAMGQPGVPLALLGLGLCWAAAAERHTVFWNSSNPR